MTKQELIKQEWEKVLPEGVKWEDVKYYIDSEGWLNKSIFQYTELKYYQLKSGCTHIKNKCRIFSLKNLLNA